MGRRAEEKEAQSNESKVKGERGRRNRNGKNAFTHQQGLKVYWQNQNHFPILHLTHELLHGSDATSGAILSPSVSSCLKYTCIIDQRNLLFNSISN